MTPQIRKLHYFTHKEPNTIRLTSLKDGRAIKIKPNEIRAVPCTGENCPICNGRVKELKKLEVASID